MQAPELYPGLQLRGGEWSSSEDRLLQLDGRPGRLAEARLPLPPTVTELGIDARMATPEQRLPGAFGWLVESADLELVICEWIPRINGLGSATLQLVIQAGDLRQERYPALPPGFNATHEHLQSLCFFSGEVAFCLDGVELFRSPVAAPAERLVLFSRGMRAAFSVVIK